MRSELWAFGLVFAALFGAPLLTLALWWLLRRLRLVPRPLWLLPAALPVLLALGLWSTGWWLWSFQATLYGAVLAWLCLGLLTALLLHTPRGRWPGLALLLLLAGGLFLGGGGAPLVLFQVGELMPSRVEQPAPGLRCHVTPFGAGTHGPAGYHVRLRAPLAVLPLLERPIGQIDMPADVPAAQGGSAAAICAEVAAALR